MPEDRSESCDVCGATEATAILSSPRLDGRLVRCRDCGLYYVATDQSRFLFTGTSQERSDALASRVAELGILCHEVDDAEEPWRARANDDRVARVRRHVPSGTLLDVGCNAGSFLRAAGRHFDAVGIDPDPVTTDSARAAGLNVQTGTLDDVTPPAGGFDAITMFHVIEHLPSPRSAVEQARLLLRPGGALVVETPTIDTLWFRLRPLRQRWRQLIPDHYYFFDRGTLTRLLTDCALAPVDYAKVGRAVSLRFAADRARRSGLPFAGASLALLQRIGAEERTVYLNPGDIMTMTARAQENSSASDA